MTDRPFALAALFALVALSCFAAPGLMTRAPRAVEISASLGDGPIEGLRGRSP